MNNTQNRKVYIHINTLMAMQKALAKIWKKPKENLGKLYTQRLTQWKEEPTVNKVEHPTRLNRARALGYKAKQGFIIARVKVPKGRRKRPRIQRGRRPKRYGRFFSTEKSKKLIAEEKAARKFRNMEVLNAYWVGEDGNFEWYECILLDRSHPVVKKDKERKWITEPQHRGRAFRGLTK
jgi:large subunit ribosomal protein L15e